MNEKLLDAYSAAASVLESDDLMTKYIKALPENIIKQIIPIYKLELKYDDEDFIKEEVIPFIKKYLECVFNGKQFKVYWDENRYPHSNGVTIEWTTGW